MNITKGQINEIGVTVTEQTTLSVPVSYLIEFKSKATKLPVYCIVTTNKSTHTDRIDLFDVEETASPNPLLAQVSLAAGDYSYKIYQQNSTTNLDPANTTVAASGFAYVESGICRVLAATSTPVPQYSGATLTNTVYEQQ